MISSKTLLCILRYFSLVLVFGYHSGSYAVPDYYKILGVPVSATQIEITKAYRKFALENHPDRNSNTKASEEKFKTGAEAYEFLGNPEKRKKYDKTYSSGYSYNQSYTQASYSQTNANFSKNSGDMLIKLQAYRGRPMNEMIYESLKMINLTFKEGQMSGRSACNYLSEIISTTGNWVQYTGGYDDVTEAAFKAVFIALKSVRANYPNEYEYYFNWSVKYLEVAHRNLSYMQDTIDFALYYKNRTWSVNSCNDYLTKQ